MVKKLKLLRKLFRVDLLTENVAREKINFKTNTFLISITRENNLNYH